MPTPNDPAMGLAGTLTMLQGQQPMTAAPNLQPVDSGRGEQQLAQAARSLESVQGSIAGQTQAIQQMSMVSQQQSANLQMLITQLSNQVSGLTQALSQMSMSARMGASATGIGATGAPPMAAPAMPGFAPAGGMAMAGAGLAFRGLHGGTRALGTLGANMVSPFAGAPVLGPGQGMVAPQFAGEPGFLRSMGMATSLGVHPSMMKQASGGQIMALGRERAQNQFTDAALSLGGGIGSLATMGIGEVTGMGIGGLMGKHMLGGGIIGGVGGFMGGMALSMPLAAAATAPVNEVMRQVGVSRGFGEQFARGAHRYMGANFGDANRRPGMMSRLRFGQQMNRMSIQDLTFNDQDMSEMFAGIQQQDLMRGVGSVEEVVRRFRETKETFKTIGRVMGQGIQEAAQTMGALQEMGIDPTSRRGRGAIFGASTILGMTPSEGFQVGAEAGNRGAARGLGDTFMLSGQVGAQLGQSAIQRGALGTRDIAALGGREGVQRANQDFMEMFLASKVGQAAMVAGPGQMGLGITETMVLGGRRANADPNLVMRAAMGDPELVREFMGENGLEGRARAYELIRSQAAELRRGNPKLDERQAQIRAMQMIASQSGRDMTYAQANAQLKVMEGLPDAMRDRSKLQVRKASEDVTSETIERTAVMARFERWGKGLLTPAADVAGEGATRAGVAFGRAADAIERTITGRDLVVMDEQLDTGLMSSLRGRGGPSLEDEQMEDPLASGDVAGSILRNKARKGRNKIRSSQRKISSSTPSQRTRASIRRIAEGMAFKHARELDELKQTLQGDATPEEKRAAMKRALSLLSMGSYDASDPNNETGAKRMRAIQDMASEILGVSPAGVLMGNELAGASSFTSADQESLKKIRGEIAETLGVSTDEAAVLATEPVANLVNALMEDDNEKISEAFQQAKDAGVDVGLLNNVRDTIASGEVDIFDVGITKGERLQELLVPGVDLTRRQATAERFQMIGGRASQALKGTSLDFLGGRLRTRSRDQLVGAFNTAISDVTQSDLGILGKGTEEQRKLGRTLGMLKDIAKDEKVIDVERNMIASLLGMDPKDDFIKNIKTIEDLGQVAAVAMDAKMPGGAGAAIEVGPQGVTNKQIETLKDVSTTMKAVMDLVNEIEKRMPPK